MIVTKNRQKVFQLWHGNLESQDGALQIFQVVDFIWTWARDVYRPQIRRCLRGHPCQREISPTSTNPIRRSQSVLSVLSARSSSQQPLLETMLEDDITAREVVNNGQPDFQDTSSHPFLRWADHRDLSTPWGPHTSIRHSDIVRFSFRILEIPEGQQSLEDLISSLKYDRENLTMMFLHALKTIQQNQCTLPLKRAQIYDLAKYWTGINAQMPYGQNTMNRRPDQTVDTFFLFRTFCQQEDWQIKREVYCVIWSFRAASVLRTFSKTAIISRHKDSLPYPTLQIHPSVSANSKNIWKRVCGIRAKQHQSHLITL